MAPRYRLSEPAEADIASILRDSRERHGVQARLRYRALLSAALRRIAGDPNGILTMERAELGVGIRSFHIRHSRDDSAERPVGNPVHVIFYRAPAQGLVEVIRVLHDRMEPQRHMDTGATPEAT